MKVELDMEHSSQKPDESAAMAARGDYMDSSLVGNGLDEAMEGTDRDLQGLLDKLVVSGHFGPFEHNNAVLRVEGVSRVVMAQVTRHRHMSFDVQSQRYVDFSDVEPVVPETLDDEAEYVHFPAVGGVIDDTTWEEAMEIHFGDAIALYEQMVDNGVPKEDARYVLPLGTPVNFTMSGNLRSMWHFLDLRNNMKAQPETRRFAAKVCEELESWAPKSMDAYERKTNNNSLRSP